MDPRQMDLLAELARDAALERSDFLVRSGEQLARFIETNRAAIRELGGLVLIDEDPDYLAIAPDGTFRSRARYFDDDSGEWVNETEIIESAPELVELYNPADIYGAFGDALEHARAGVAGDDDEDEDEDEDDGVDGGSREDPYAAAADRWAASPESLETPSGAAPGSIEEAAQRLYDLALDFQERSQASEARLIADFDAAAGLVTPLLGEVVITEDDDERLVLEPGLGLAASVLTEEDGQWRALRSPEALVEYYDPTDIFSDLADAIAEVHPSVAPEPTAWDGEDEAGADDDEDGDDGEGDRRA